MHRPLPRRLLLPSLFVLMAGIAGAQPAPAASPLLTLDRIFTSQEFAPERFGPARWMTDGDSYTTLERSPDGAGRDLVRYRADTGRREILVPAAKLVPPGASAPIAIDDYAWSPDGRVLIVMTDSRRVWRQNTRGDFWTCDLATGRLRKLGAGFEPSTLMFAKLSPDGRMAAYVVKSNIYVEDLATGAIRRLTYDGSDDVINGTSDWVNEEEFGIRDGFRWSPDSRSIAFWQFDTHGVPVFTMIDNTDDLYPRTITFKHPKAGQPNSAVRVGVVPAAGGPVVWMKTAGDPHDLYIPLMDWAGNSTEVVFQQLNRLQNTLEVQIGSASSGAVRTVLVDRDAAWVDHMDRFVWVGAASGLVWLSERDGWRHAYYVARDGKTVRLITPGDYDVMSVEGVDERAGLLYVTASPADATARFEYRVRMDGTGKPELVGPAGQAGVHRYDISPGTRWAFHTFSTLDTPPQTDLVRLPGGETVRPLATNAALRAKVEALARQRVEFQKLDIGDGVTIDSWRILPPGFDPAKKYPLLVYVYGEPAGQTVQNAWGGNTYLWHLMLAQQGYVVASFDNRGTPAPRGRAWRKSIYRQVGILASADQAAAVRAALAAWPCIDADRVGVWGWSGGGSMTLNAMFRHPDLYKIGMAVAFVSDQRLYDSIYQERYMGLPQDNAEGYRDGSPITFAKNLRGSLLIVHGTGDDNVHYQNFEKLVNELVANGKPFTMMSYPNRSHGISEGKGTTLHLYTLLTSYLKSHLPPVIALPAGSGPVEQKRPGRRPAPARTAAFDGLGASFAGPQGARPVRNPSDNSLAVGPDHIVQIVNTEMAIFTKKGKRFDTTGRVLYGAAPTNRVFRGFGGMCEATNNGDAVVRYDQLADRWLIVMPIFRRAPARPDQPAEWTARPTAYLSPPGRPGQPGPAVRLPEPASEGTTPAGAAGVGAANAGARAARDEAATGPYSMCYAVSAGPDPMGPYYRYEFLRPLFPDYPRPAVWPDGYYVATSTGDNPISDAVTTEKHACVVDRARMLRGEPATEQCLVVDDVGFLNNADLDGKALPPAGAPNIVMATGGTQLQQKVESDRIDVWQFHVDWTDPAKSRLGGPQAIAVAPYRYLCGGQLTRCVPQPGSEFRLDAQGDKIMSRLVYRRIGGRESIVAAHSVDTTGGTGGVRWYEFRVGPDRSVRLHQQGTYAPDASYRWMPSPAIDRFGNIAIGYSFGGTPHFAGQRFAARLAGDPPGLLTLAEAVLVEGEASQPAMRWEDYTQTAVDPSDDCTIWYVGDYLKKGATAYSTRIGAFTLPGCAAR